LRRFTDVAQQSVMAKKTDTVEHRVRMHMLGVITEVGDAKTASEGARVSPADRKWLGEKLQRMQAVAHEILARIEAMEERSKDH
jgi:hypothetical protein